MAEAVAELRARFLKSAGKEELSQRLIEILPLDDFSIMSVQGATNNFNAVVECSIFESSEESLSRRQQTTNNGDKT